MSALEDYIQRTVDAAPPLSLDQRDRLALIFRGHIPNPAQPLSQSRAPVATPLALPPPVPEPEPPCALYRFWDDDGTLLYVGISTSPHARAVQHHSAKWYQFVARHKVEWLDHRSAAEVAEREAIKQERPVFNISQRVVTDRDVADYLLARFARLRQTEAVT